MPQTEKNDQKMYQFHLSLSSTGFVQLYLDRAIFLGYPVSETFLPEQGNVGAEKHESWNLAISAILSKHRSTRTARRKGNQNRETHTKHCAGTSYLHHRMVQMLIFRRRTSSNANDRQRPNVVINHTTSPFTSSSTNQSIRYFNSFIKFLYRFIMLVLLPIGLGNFARILIDQLTYSKTGIRNELVHYWQSMEVLTPLAQTNNTAAGTNYKLVYIGANSGSIIGEYHNIIVFYTSKMIRNAIMSKEDTFLKRFLLKWYSLLVKILTTCLLLAYGSITTCYMWFALVFFSVCVCVSIYMKFKPMMKIVTTML